MCGLCDNFASGVCGADTRPHCLFYVRSPSDGANFGGCITESWDALNRWPVFSSASLNKPSQPLIVGPRPKTRGDRLSVTSDALVPDGVPWAASQWCL